MKPIIAYHHLDFTKRDFVVVVADTLDLGRQAFNKRFPHNQIAPHEAYQDSTGLCNVEANGACTLLFAYSSLSASLICHEVTHATNAMFLHIGIELCSNSDEAFAYHNDMLFRTVAELLNKHSVTIPLLPPRS